MKLLEPENIVAVLDGENGSRIAFANPTPRDKEWCKLTIQLEADWYIASIDVEFSRASLESFYSAILVLPEQKEAQFYTEYGYFGLNLRFEARGNILIKGESAKTLLETSKLIFEFESTLTAVDTFGNGIKKIFSQW